MSARSVVSRLVTRANERERERETRRRRPSPRPSHPRDEPPTHTPGCGTAPTNTRVWFLGTHAARRARARARHGRTRARPGDDAALGERERERESVRHGASVVRPRGTRTREGTRARALRGLFNTPFGWEGNTTEDERRRAPSTRVEDVSSSVNRTPLIMGVWTSTRLHVD